MCLLGEIFNLENIILERKKSYELWLLLNGLNAAATLPRREDRYSTSTVLDLEH